MRSEDSTAPARRSPIQHLLERDGAAVFASWRGGQVVQSMAKGAGLPGLWLFDASAAERRRVMRSRAPAKDGGLTRGQAARLGGDWLAFRAGPADLAFLPPLTRAASPAPAAPLAWKTAADEPGFQEGYWFYVTGFDAPQLFTRGCEVDMRPSRFGDLAVSQVLLFRTPVTVVREDRGASPGYHILGCNSFAHHLYTKLGECQGVHGGGILGLDDLLASLPA